VFSRLTSIVFGTSPRKYGGKFGGLIILSNAVGTEASLTTPKPFDACTYTF
jgi:hypothetical protein